VNATVFAYLPFIMVEPRHKGSRSTYEYRADKGAWLALIILTMSILLLTSLLHDIVNCFHYV